MELLPGDTTLETQGFFQTYVRRGKDQCEFELSLSAKRHWMLHEHRIGELVALPATGFVELILAACRLYFHWSMIEVTKLTICQPLLMQEDEEGILKILFTGNEDQSTFSVTFSRTGSDVVEHVTGMAKMITAQIGERMDIERHIAAYQSVDFKEQQEEKPGYPETSYQLKFGRRWTDVHRQLWRGEESGIAWLMLAPDFEEDIKTYAVHPALLDVAITLLLDSAMLAPFQFKSIRYYHPLPAQYYCHATLHPAAGGVETDIIITDRDGNILLEIEKYYLLEVSENQLTSITGK